MDLPDTSIHASSIRRRAFKWRLTTINAGLLLAAAFFMPAVKSCGSPEIPAETARELLNFNFATDNLSAYIGGFAMFVAAYTIGLLAALAAAARLFKADRLHGPIMAAILVSCTLIALNQIYLTYVETTANVLAIDLFSSDILSLDGLHGMLSFLIFPGWLLLAIGLSVRSRARRWLCPMFVICLWLVTWFSYWLLTIDWAEIYYGLWLSELASIALLIATVGEAVVLSDQSIPRTLWQLLTCRIKLADDMKGRCKACGYLLHGLPEPRCPECGQPFVPEDHPCLAPSRATG